MRVAQTLIWYPANCWYKSLERSKRLWLDTCSNRTRINGCTAMHCYFQGKGCEIFPMDLMMAQEGSQLKKDLGFPGGSDGNKSACKAGNRVSIPGSGRSLEEGNGCWWWTGKHGVLQSLGSTTEQLNWTELSSWIPNDYLELSSFIYYLIPIYLYLDGNTLIRFCLLRIINSNQRGEQRMVTLWVKTEVIRATISLLGELEGINDEGLSVQFSMTTHSFCSLRRNETESLPTSL